jgi:putative ABC transport system permease protein
MAAFERVREIGTLLALGMPRSQVRILFLMEGAVLGFGGGALGASLGALLVYHWQVNGFSIGDEVMTASGSMAVSQYVYTQFGWGPTLLSVGFGAFIAVAASIWPANNASKIIPADAVKAD